MAKFNNNSSTVIQTHHDELLPQLVDDFLVRSSQRNSIKHGQTGKRQREKRMKMRLAVAVTIICSVT